MIHFQLAAGYQQAAPGGVGQGNLFRIHAAASLLTAVFILIKGNSPAFVAAALVMLSAFAAAILSRYVPLPDIGPIPSMYEPVWFTEKVVATVVEGIAGVLSVAGYLQLRKDAGRLRSSRSGSWRNSGAGSSR
ncbi:hypothetical protein [Arthrobacter sp. PAMC25284]|uniref:hypothetical protein n=1 Tax=Arthrobacter sp. PAMC25284 TaxID=2861279 RepID=UPI001C628237|nr:hypothetical protein [Arthrobacter sp. PAMC25284]QYF91051.1 hypothetical protein KY499_07610 [Arthrobacter sp. PAMC25284]